MENDFNLKMNLTQRARKANKIANNLANEIESVNNIKILSKVYDNDIKLLYVLIVFVYALTENLKINIFLSKQLKKLIICCLCNRE